MAKSKSILINAPQDHILVIINDTINSLPENTIFLTMAIEGNQAVIVYHQFDDPQKMKHEEKVDEK